MSKLRICMLTTFYPPHNFGGDGIGVQRLARAFGRRGHEVTVIHDVDAYNALHEGPEPPDSPEAENVRAVRLRSGLGLLSPLLTHQTGRPIVHGARINRIFEEGEYDVTLFNNVSLVGGPALMQAGRGITVYEAHEHWLVCPTHVLWRHDREPCTGRECLRCVLAHRRPPQLWRYTGLLDRSIEKVDAFVAKSEFSRLKHAEFGFGREMSVIPYFLPDTPVEGVTASPGRGRPYFLFVGRLEKIKGLDDVIPAFERYPDADLLIAGDGEHATALRQMAAGMSNVHFLGRLAPAELRSLYRGATALIVPSTGFETFGIILIEAFREGAPVIARRIGPFPEIVEKADGGLLFGDAAELLDAMTRMQKEAGLRERLGSNARAGYEANWTEAAVVPRYFQLFRQIAERTGRGRVADKLSMEGVA